MIARMAIVLCSEALTEELVIRPAENGEEDIELDLLAQAAAWLRSRGIEQWPERFPSSSVREQIAGNEALLVWDAGQPIATVVVADSDTELWAEDGTSACYVSRLAVARRAAGADLGYRIVGGPCVGVAEAHAGMLTAVQRLGARSPLSSSHREPCCKDPTGPCP